MTIISVEDAKAHLNLDTDDDNTLIAAKITAAEAWLANFIGNALDDDAAFPNGTPAPLLEAVRLLVGHLYENREGSLVGVPSELLPLGIYDLVAPYREYVF